MPKIESDISFPLHSQISTESCLHLLSTCYISGIVLNARYRDQHQQTNMNMDNCVCGVREGEGERGGERE